jgi:hypothetical protein
MRCCEDVHGGDCHCGLCHETFSSLTLFDAHQDVDYSRRPAVVCRAPAGLGLVRDYRSTWATPQAAISRQRRALAMAERNRPDR